MSYVFRCDRCECFQAKPGLSAFYRPGSIHDLRSVVSAYLMPSMRDEKGNLAKTETAPSVELCDDCGLLFGKWVAKQ